MKQEKERNASLKAYRRGIYEVLSSKKLETDTLEKTKNDLEKVYKPEQLEELLILAANLGINKFLKRLKEATALSDSIWSQEKEVKARLNGYRDLIIIFLRKKETDFEVNNIQRSLNDINDEEKLINLVQLAVQVESDREFLKYI